MSVLGQLPPQVGDDLRERWKAEPPHGGRPIQFVDVFPKTADRKVDLFPPALDKQAPMGLYGYQPDPATGEFPLALISPASERTISSTLGELSRPEVRLEMNPDDAEARGIEDGDAIRVWNALGEMRINAQRLATGQARHRRRCRKACGAATPRTATRRTRWRRIR